MTVTPFDTSNDPAAAFLHALPPAARHQLHHAARITTERAVTADPRVLITRKPPLGWDDECAPEQRANAARDDLHHPTAPEAPVPMIIPDRRQRNPHRRGEPSDDAATIAHLRELLTEAIKTRDDLVVRLMDVYVPEIDRHWYVDDVGYCKACNLPEGNARHAPRADDR